MSKEIDWSLKGIWGFTESLGDSQSKKADADFDEDAPWKLNIVEFMMQLWEGNSKEKGKFLG